MGDDASQGPDLWWYLRLTGTVEIDRSAESEGNTVLWVDVNGYASALLQYFVEGDGEIVWKSANYRGTLGGNESSSVIPFSFENVLPTPAVRPGNAKVRVFLETYENPGQVKVQVDPASSFVVSRSNPQELQLQYGAPKDENALIRVPMVLKNSGSSPALDVAIRVEAQPNVVIQEPVSIVRLGDLNVAAEFSVLLTPPPEGQSGRIKVTATGTEKNDRASIVLEIQSHDRGPDTGPWLLAAGLAVTVAGFLLAVPWRKLKPRGMSSRRR